MDEKDWVVLITLFEEKNMTKARERLYMTQPALSYRLKNLEAQFGVRLFYKRKKGWNSLQKVNISLNMRKRCHGNSEK